MMVRRLHQQKFKNSQRNEQQQTKNSVPDLKNVTESTSSEQLRKVICKLEDTIQKQVCSKSQLEQILLDYRKRSVMRENQFRKILSHYNQDVTKINSPKPVILQNLYKQVLTSFEEQNKQAQKLLQMRLEENYKMCTQKINDLVKTTKFEVDKYRKRATIEFDKIRRQIQDTRNLAKQIDNENLILRLKVNDYEVKNKLLIEQKNLMLQQLHNKKKIMRKVVTEEVKRRRKNSISSETHFQVKTGRKSNIQSQQYRKSISTPEKNIESCIKWQEKVINNGKSQKKSICTSKETEIYSKIQQKKEQTIKHLMKILQRQRKKMIILGKTVTELQKKFQWIYQAIEKCFKQTKNGSSQVVINLQEIMRQIRNKMLNIEYPSLNDKKNEDLLTKKSSDILFYQS